MTLVIESTFIKSSKCSIPIWISWIFVVKFQLKNPNFLLVHLLSHTFFFCSRELRIQINPPFSFQILSDRALWQSLSSKKDHSNNTIRRTNIQDMAPQIWHKHISLLFYLLRIIVTHLVFPNTLFSGCFLLCTRLSCIFFLNTFFVLRRHTNSMMNLSHITPLKWNLFWISWNHDLN